MIGRLLLTDVHGKRRWWKVFRRSRTLDGEPVIGLCDWTAREISIDPSVEGTAEELATIVHEVAHAVAPYLTEDTVLALEEGIVAGIKLITKETHETQTDRRPHRRKTQRRGRNDSRRTHHSRRRQGTADDRGSRRRGPRTHR